MTTFDVLTSRYTLTCCIHSDSGLHIGTGIPSPVTDSPFVREAGRPLLPGSSLRGAVRSNLERILRALPLNGAVRKFIESRERVYVVEQNRDAQMTQILRMNHPDLAARLRPILHYNGLPIDAAFITENFLQMEKELK